MKRVGGDHPSQEVHKVHIMATIIQVLKNLAIKQLCTNTMEEWLQLHQGINK
jgi:hypothetical protein